MDKTNEMIVKLINDLDACAKKRREGVQYFSEELVILRLKEILKEGGYNDNIKNVQEKG